MPDAPRRGRLTCPTCGLTLAIVLGADEPAVEYDMAEWARQCRHPGLGSPLVCPSLEPLIKGWLGNP